MSQSLSRLGVSPCPDTTFFGAVEPITGESFFLEMPWLNGVCFQYSLTLFQTRLNILVLDNGSFHYAKSLKLPDNIALIFLPPYSPELNPIERLWQDIAL